MRNRGRRYLLFCGLPKNACCYSRELGLSESEAGGMLAMSPEMARYSSRRKRILTLVNGVADAVPVGNVVGLWKEAEGNRIWVGGN